MNLKLALLVFSIAFSGTAWASDAPATKEKCLEMKGVWGTFAMPGYPGAVEHCRLPAPDAGKACRSSNDCSLGVCEAKDGLFNEGEGKAAAGECPAFFTGFGCVARIEDGKIQPTVCAN
jgi:hypothetical protein